MISGSIPRLSVFCIICSTLSGIANLPRDHSTDVQGTEQRHIEKPAFALSSNLVMGSPLLAVKWSLMFIRGRSPGFAVDGARLKPKARVFWWPNWSVKVTAKSKVL